MSETSISFSWSLLISNFQRYLSSHCDSWRLREWMFDLKELNIINISKTCQHIGGVSLNHHIAFLFTSVFHTQHAIYWVGLRAVSYEQGKKSEGVVGYKLLSCLWHLLSILAILNYFKMLHESFWSPHQALKYTTSVTAPTSDRCNLWKKSISLFWRLCVCFEKCAFPFSW